MQQAGHDHPMDDIVIEFKDAVGPRVLGSQVKRQLRISAANDDFSSVMAVAFATRARDSFRPARDACGFVVECQIASNRDPVFASKSDPADVAKTGGAEPHRAKQSRSWRPASGE